jgi:superfamily II DNA helicase RecQ
LLSRASQVRGGPPAPLGLPPAGGGSGGGGGGGGGGAAVSAEALDSAIDFAAQEHFGVPAVSAEQRAVVQAVVREGSDVIHVMETGGGKSLSGLMSAFFLPGVLVWVTPLCVLGNQVVAECSMMGLRAVKVRTRRACASARRCTATA